MFFSPLLTMTWKEQILSSFPSYLSGKEHKVGIFTFSFKAWSLFCRIFHQLLPLSDDLFTLFHLKPNLFFL